jgi:hypothetical protein
MTIKSCSKFVRSKNAGPFWITIDVFCDNEKDYSAIKNSHNMTIEKLAIFFNTKGDLLKMFFLDDLMVIKISIPRDNPQGFRYERDMHAGQQYVSFLDYRI